MTIFVFGNPDLKEDNLPIRILPELEKKFPKINFVLRDPNEEWDLYRDSRLKSGKLKCVFSLPRRYSAVCRGELHSGRRQKIIQPFWILDTVKGIKKIKIFSGISEFKNSPRLTLHDFDVYSMLCLLKKLNKLPPLKIIGIPSKLKEREALKQVSEILRKEIKNLEVGI